MDWRVEFDLLLRRPTSRIASSMVPVAPEKRRVSLLPYASVLPRWHLVLVQRSLVINGWPFNTWSSSDHPFWTLQELFGPGAAKLRVEQKVFLTPSRRRLDVQIVESNYHLELTPADVAQWDRTVIQDVLKEVGQSAQLDARASRRFKVVVIHSADELTNDAQAALRRTMERHTSTMRLILCANSTAKIIGPIRSRCLLLRVGAPETQEVSLHSIITFIPVTHSLPMIFFTFQLRTTASDGFWTWVYLDCLWKLQIVKVLHTVAKKECFVNGLPEETAMAIASSSKGNLRRALLTLETIRAQDETFSKVSVTRRRIYLSYW